jgi:hypothetical protein
MLVSGLVPCERRRCVRTPQVEAADFLLDHRRNHASVDLELGCTWYKADVVQLLLFDHMARASCQLRTGAEACTYREGSRSAARRCA